MNQKNTYMIFSNMKQDDLFVIVFVLVKLVQLRLKRIKTNLLKYIVEFNDKSRSRTKEGKNKKRDTYESTYALYEGQELTLNAFKCGMFPIKTT